MFEKTLENKNTCLYNKTMNIEIKNSNYTTQEKLQILADAAKYDVACTSSGSSRRGKKGELGYRGMRYLSQFCSGRKVYFFIKDSDDKSLCL